MQHVIYFSLIRLNHIPSAKNYSLSGRIPLELKPSGNMTISGVIFDKENMM